MLRTIIVEIPETTFVVIEEQAHNKGIEPSELVVEWLDEAIHRIQNVEPDPLDELIGALDAPIHDLAERHDEYLGQALIEEIRNGPSIR